MGNGDNYEERIANTLRFLPQWSCIEPASPPYSLGSILGEMCCSRLS